MDTTKPGAAGSAGEGVLANFFNSLLHKKTGSPAGSPGVKTSNDLTLTGSPHVVLDKAAMRSDAAAELDRLTRKKPPNSTTTVTTNNTDHNSSEC